MVAMARSLKKVNAEIKKQIGNYTLRKGLGYFYVTSDDPIKDLKLSGLFTASIQVCHLNHQSIEQWLLDVKEIVSNSENVVIVKEQPVKGGGINCTDKTKFNVVYEF